MSKKLRVLFISGELIAGDLAYRLKKEGCSVKLYIKDKSRKDCYKGMVSKTNDWKKELKWVGKDGLIVFDDVGYGKTQDGLRKQGYLVVGGSEGGDKLEKDRKLGQKILSQAGIKTVPSKNFSRIDDAIEFVKKHKSKWVLKQSGHTSMLNYVGELNDGSDVVSVLKSYKNFKNIQSVSLQEKINGIEIGVARYFNGSDWIGPIEFNIEHKSLFNGDIGPKTGEMGTIIWYEDNENIKLFRDILAKLKPYLKKINFKGDIDINFIINEKGAFPLEFTARFGCPSTQLQAELHLSPWKEFLLAVAKGKKYQLKYKKGFGVVVSVSIPPFPYKAIHHDYYEYYSKGAEILFREKLSKEEMNQIHFEEVSFNPKTGNYYISGSNGFILYVTGSGKTVEDARESAYDLVDKLVIPKMFYRTDIGEKFMNEDEKKLKEWGWI